MDINVTKLHTWTEVSYEVMADFEQGIQEKSVGSWGVIIHNLEQSPKCRGSLLFHFKKKTKSWWTCQHHMAIKNKKPWNACECELVQENDKRKDLLERKCATASELLFLKHQCIYLCYTELRTEHSNIFVATHYQNDIQYVKPRGHWGDNSNKTEPHEQTCIEQLFSFCRNTLLHWTV